MLAGGVGTALKAGVPPWGLAGGALTAGVPPVLPSGQRYPEVDASLSTALGAALVFGAAFEVSEGLFVGMLVFLDKKPKSLCDATKAKGFGLSALHACMSELECANVLVFSAKAVAESLLCCNGRSTVVFRAEVLCIALVVWTEARTCLESVADVFNVF